MSIMEAMGAVYIGSDYHKQFDKIQKFCKKHHTRPEDVLIILGDPQINYEGEVKDAKGKKLLSALPITLFCIHGNHEMRPGTIGTYREKRWHGGIVYYEEAYPNLLFPKDGEIFDFHGKSTLVQGGAYSPDKMYRCSIGPLYGDYWFEDEQPSEEIKAYTEQQLAKRGWKVDVVLTHTAPKKYVPTEAYLQSIYQDSVDDSTERWLDQIEDKLDYQKWYCGHFHIMKKIDRVEFVFQTVLPFECP